MKVNKKFVGPSFEEDLKRRMKDSAFAEQFKQEHIKYEIAHLVKNARKRAGLTQAELARLAGIHQTAIARIESRTSKTVPSIELLRKTFKPLGFNVAIRLQKLKKAA
jgi:DNA-binding XRE family transcriptional regulator